MQVAIIAVLNVKVLLLSDSRPIDSDPIWNMHVLYFWKALSTGMLELILPGVWHANTQTQIHKYCVYTNTVNDEMSVNPMKCYIFGKPLMQGCRKWYLELSTMPIQKMCLTLSPLVSLMYRAKCINPRVNNSPKFMVVCYSVVWYCMVVMVWYGCLL